MINITRGKRPGSLDNPDIKTYLDEVIFYNNLSEEDRKNTPQPKGGISYRNSDVLEAFDRNFYSKCYLTEQKYQTAYSMDIEHFRSKAFGQFPELKYEWSNLYPCSHDANMSKPRIEPIGGYLDPCDSNDDVEKEIVYTLEMGGVTFFDVLNENNLKAINTCQLLDRIHNGTNDYSKKKTPELRFLISKKEREVIDLIMEYLNEKDNEDKIRVSRKIKNILSRKSDFTMLLRSLSSVRKYVPDDFLD
jgi:hypothetical protein